MIRTLCLIAGFSLLCHQTISQTITSTTSGGNWNLSSTWVGGIIPDTNNTTHIIIAGIVVVPSSYATTSPLLIDQVEVAGGTLIIDAGSVAQLKNGSGTDLSLSDGGILLVYGTLKIANGTTFAGNNQANVLYQPGSICELQYTSASTNFPAASFDPSSTLLITGFTSGTMGNSYTLPFGSIIYNCGNQGSSIVNFAGAITKIAGNLDVVSTGSGTGAINFNTNGNLTASIGGHLSVTGPSRILLTSSGNSTITVGGDFIFNPDPLAAYSQSASTGTGVLVVNANTSLISGIWDLASGNNGSGNFSVAGDFNSSGTIILSSGNNTAHGTLTFNGNQKQSIQAGDVSNANLAAVFDNANGFQLKGNFITQGSLSLMQGTIELTDGALAINGPLEVVSGAIAGLTNAQLRIGGSGEFPDELPVITGSSFSILEIDRPVTVSCRSNVVVSRLNLHNGTINNTGILTIAENGLIERTGDTNGVGNIVFPVQAAQLYDLIYTTAVAFAQGPEYPANTGVLKNLSKNGSGTLQVTFPLNTIGDVSVNSGTLDDMSSALTHVIGGNLSLSGVINFPESVLQFRANSSGSVFSGPGSLTARNIIFGGTLMIDSNFSITGDITVESGGFVTTNSGKGAFLGTSTIFNHGRISLHDIEVGTNCTLTAPDSLGIHGNMTLANTSSTFDHNGGTVIFSGSTTLLGTGKMNFNHIAVARQATLKGAVNVNLDGNLTNDGTITLTSGLFQFNGAHAVVTGNAISTTLSAVNFNGSSPILISIPFTANGLITIYDSLISSGGISAKASLTVSAHAALVARENEIRVDGTFTVSTLGSFYALAGANILLSGNLSCPGNYFSNSITQFTGTTIMTGSGIKQFHDIVVSGSITPNAVYSVDGNLSVTKSGVLFPGANTINFNGPASFLTSDDGQEIRLNNISLAAGAGLTVTTPLRCNNVVVSGNFIVNNGLAVAGTVNVSVDTGRVEINAKPFTIAGSLTVSSGAEFKTSDGADATFLGDISASGTLHVPGAVKFNGSTTLTGGGDKVFGDITIAGLFKPNAAFTTSGNFSVLATGSMPEGTSTTTFAGAQAIFTVINGGNATFHNVIIGDGGNVTIQSPMHCNGTFRTTGIFNAGAELSVVGTCTISRGGFFLGGLSTLTLGGNFAISGTFTTAGLTRFTGNTVISGAGQKKFVDIEIAGRLTSAPGDVFISGNFTNDGEFIHNNGSITFTGNTEKIISSTVPNPQVINFYSLVLQGGSSETDLRCEMNVSITNEFRINTTTGAAVIDVDGAENNYVFTLCSLSDNPAQDGSIGSLPDDAMINGSVTAQRYLSGEGRIYRYLCTPMHGYGATVAAWQKSFPITGHFADPNGPELICGKVIDSASPSLYYYDEPLQQYIPYPVAGTASESLLQSGRGYAAFVRNCSDSTIISVSGAIENGVNRGTVNLPLTHTGMVVTYNNLAGNPFPSAIDWDKVALSNVSATIAIRDNASGVFQYYTQGGTGALDIANGVIVQGQAFWVRTTGPNPLATISENSKVPGSAAAGNIFYRTRPSFDYLELLITSAKQRDHARISIIQNSSDGNALDNFDSPKMNNQRDDPYEDLLDLSTQMSRHGPALALNAIPSLTCDQRIMINIDGASGPCELSFRKSGIVAAFNVRLYDSLSSTFINEDAAGVMHLMIEEGDHRYARFVMVFTPIAADTSKIPTAPEFVCSQDTLNIVINQPQPGFSYSTIAGGGVQRGSLDDEQDHSVIKIPASLLAENESKLIITATSLCSTADLTQRVSVKKLTIPALKAEEGKICRRGSTQLRVVEKAQNTEVSWYDDQHNLVGVTDAFQTPVLISTHAYFVLQRDPISSCVSKPILVHAKVVSYNDAAFTMKGPNVLISNYASGNTWYMNNLLQADTSASLVINASGEYRLRVNIEGCETDFEQLVSISGTEDHPNVINVWPNPVHEILHIEIIPEITVATTIPLYTSSGCRIGSVALKRGDHKSEGEFDFSGLAAGEYLLRAEPSDNGFLVRIVKD